MADAEAIVVGFLAPLHDPIRVVTDLDGIDWEEEGNLPLIHVEESPTGAQITHGLDLCHVDIDVFAKADGVRTARQVAWDLAEVVRRQIVEDLPRAGPLGVSGVSVNRAGCPRKPGRLPYDDSDMRRYGGTYHLYIHSP